MSNAAGRVVASSHYSTTHSPVVFSVHSERAEAVVGALNAELSEMYVKAWRDAIGAVMDDCGWSYETPQDVRSTRVERVRTGRPRVIHGVQIESQLAGAVKAVDDVLDSILVAEPTLAAAVTKARASFPAVFEWRITENYGGEVGEHRTMELLGSTYIDLTAAAESGANA